MQIFGRPGPQYIGLHPSRVKYDAGRTRKRPGLLQQPTRRQCRDHHTIEEAQARINALCRLSGTKAIQCADVEGLQLRLADRASERCRNDQCPRIIPATALEGRSTVGFRLNQNDAFSIACKIPVKLNSVACANMNDGAVMITCLRLDHINRSSYCWHHRTSLS